MIHTGVCFSCTLLNELVQSFMSLLPSKLQNQHLFSEADSVFSSSAVLT